MKIALINATLNSIEPLMYGLSKKLSKDDIVLHFINEYLLDRAMNMGKIDARAVQIFTELVFSAMEAEPDIIVVGCSVYFPYVPLLESFVSVPIMAIDAPMLETAAEKGLKIGLIATTFQTAAATEKRLSAIAEKKGKTLEILAEALPQAFDLLCAGDVKGHNSAIVEAGESLAKQGCDYILLCQISMSRASADMQHLKARVLNSVDTGVDRIFQLK